MSYDQAQNLTLDANALLRENNSLRLTIDNLHEELHSLKFKSSTAPNPFLETQFLSLKNENQQLLNERTQLIRQLQSPRVSVNSPGGMERLMEQVEALLEENKRLNDTVIELRQRNSHIESVRVVDRNSYLGMGDDEYSTLQGKLALLASETDRLNQLLSGKDREIEGLRDALNSTDSSKILILELENKVLILGAENERLNAVLNDRNREIETLHLKISSLGRNNSINNDQSQSHAGLESLVAEIDHLNLLLQDKEREIETLRVNRASALHSQSQRSSLRNHKEMEKRTGQFGFAEGEEGRIRHLEHSLHEAEAKIKELERENEVRLIEIEEMRSGERPSHERMGDLSREVEVWKEKYRDVLNESKQQEQYQSEIRILKNEVEKLKGIIEQKNRQLESWQEKFRDIHNTTEERLELENRIATLVTETEKVNDLLVEKDHEIEKMRQKNNTIVNIEEKIAALVEENLRIMKELGEKTVECEGWKDKYVQIEENMGVPQAARGRVIEMERRLRALEGENDRLKGAVNEKLREIDALRKKVKESKEQLESWKSKYYEQDGAFMRTSQVSGQLEGKVNRMKQENMRLSTLLDEKVKQNADLQVRNYTVMELEGKLKGVTQEKERLEILNERQRTEISEMSEKTVRFEITELKLREVEKQLTLLVKENEDLKALLRDREMDMGDMRTTMGDLEETSTKVYKLEEMLEVLATENERASIEAEDRRREVKEWKDKVKDLQGRNMKVAELETRIELLASENERLSNLLKKKEKILHETEEAHGVGESYRDRVTELEETVRWLAEEAENLKAEMERRERHVETLEARARENKGEGANLSEVQARLNMLEAENVGLRQVLEEREGEIQRWRMKSENNARQVEGERELQQKVRILQSENEDLKGSVVGKNAEMGEIVKKNKQLEEAKEKGQKVAMEKVLISAEIERLWEEVAALRKEKALLEKKDIAVSRTSYRSGGGLRSPGLLGSGEKYSLHRGEEEEDEDNIGGMGALIDELSKENVRLEGLLSKKERELEYFREKGSEYDRVEMYLGTAEGKLEIVAKENERLNERIRDAQNEIEKLNDRLREKEIEVQRLQARLASREGGSSEGYSELEHQMDILQREIERLTKTNKDYLKDIESWRNKHMALEKGYFKIGELEIRLEEANKDTEKLREALNAKTEEVDIWKKKYLTIKKKVPDAIGDVDARFGSLEKSIEDLNYIGLGLDRSKEELSNIDDIDRERLIRGISTDSFKLSQGGDPNLDSIKRTLEKREKELRSLRGEDTLISDTLNVLGRSPGSNWEAKEERTYEYYQGTSMI